MHLDVEWCAQQYTMNKIKPNFTELGRRYGVSQNGDVTFTFEGSDEKAAASGLTDVLYSEGLVE